MVLQSRDLTSATQPKFYRSGLNSVKWEIDALLKSVSTSIGRDKVKSNTNCIYYFCWNLLLFFSFYMFIILRHLNIVPIH